MQAILIPVAAETYALSCQSVREVVPNPRITPVPTSPASVLGLFNVRGEILFVFDTAALLGLGRLEKPSASVVVETRLGEGALATSGQPQVTELGDLVGASEQPWGLGLYSAGSRLAVLLDVDALLAPNQGRI